MNHSLIVAVPVGSETHTYEDGDVVPIHQTIVYFGSSKNVSTGEAHGLRSLVDVIAGQHNAIMARISGRAQLGPDGENVVLTESYVLSNIYRSFADNEFVKNIMRRTAQYPQWIPHVSGMGHLKYGDFLTFDRLGFWHGDDRFTVPLSSGSVVDPRLLVG
jgi:hypothetical protein